MSAPRRAAGAPLKASQRGRTFAPAPPQRFRPGDIVSWQRYSGTLDGRMWRVPLAELG